MPSPEFTNRPVSPNAEAILGPENRFTILDHGFVYLVDYMGGDEAITQAARVSYGSGTKSVSSERGLIRYLWRNQHTTPFEMVELKFHAKMPIFVARQWVRHRTANINEYSGRYSILDREFYVPSPEAIATQSSDNKQGRGEGVNSEQAELVRRLIIEDAERNYSHYEEMIGGQMRIARELARIGLSLNFYTQWYWKIDLHNLFHFLRLRMDAHAQYEIREYANAMFEIAKNVAPLACEAFVDYSQNSVSFSGLEKNLLMWIVGQKRDDVSINEASFFAEQNGLSNGRERQEAISKFKNLGLIH